jgi:hypothetical protein
VSFRQKQKMAGAIGALGALLLLVAVGGLVARTVSRSPADRRIDHAAEERSGGGQIISPANLSIAPAVTDRATTLATAAVLQDSPDEAQAVPEQVEPDAGGRNEILAHYPLAVGRYWVYRYHERDSDVITQVERSITRRERRDGASDLFFFADGTIAYVEAGKIYEMGSNGGVNIIPVQAEVATDPVRYRSQGLQIEKWLATSDTAVVIDGHRFEQCLEVVTRFRPADEVDRAAVSYSSFYAPGIGLVGRQQWPTDASGTLAVTLSEYGTRASPSIADGQL